MTSPHDACDAIRAALAEPDPITALRATAIDLSARLSEAAVDGAFSAVCEDLAEGGRDEDAANVAYVMDMIREWRAGGRAPF